MHILLIEDDKDLLEILQFWLLIDFEVPCRIASNNKSAIEEFEQLAPKIILLDYILEDGQCDGFVTHYKSKPSRPPIIMLSAAGEEAKQYSQTHALDHFLFKPFELDELSQVVKKYLTV